MEKLRKFIKYNWLILLPFVFFLFLIVIGIITQVPIVIIMGVVFMIVLLVALFVKLKRYE